MLAPSLTSIVLLSAALAEARSAFHVNHVHAHHRRQNADLDGFALVASALQTASSKDGSTNGVSAPGQAKSEISQNNFINYCKGKTLTNGLQAIDGSCNSIPMGEIPSKQNMVSSIITFPLHASTTIEANTTFTVTVQMMNFVAGSFTNAQNTYYSAPQFLQDGKIVGHTHITIQDMGPNLNPKQALNPIPFVFFKGINDAGDGNGLLSAVVTGGLPEGNYRACTMASSSNHQPVLMPMAQRGAQDDCTKFTIVRRGEGNGGGNGGNGNNGNGAVPSSASSTQVEATVKQTTSTTATLVSTRAPFANSSISGVRTTKAGNQPRPPKTQPTRLTTTRRGNNAPPASTTTRKTTTRIAQTASRAQTTPPAPQPTTTRKNSASIPTTQRDTTPPAQQPTTTRKNSASIPTTRRDTTPPAPPSTRKSSAVIQSTTRGATAPTRRPNNVNNNRPHRVEIIKIIHRITIIRTIFKFRNSLGGLPPAVNKNGNKFSVGDKVFNDLPSACQAACGQQFKSCTSFKGPGFEIQKCEIQRKQCDKAAEVVVSQPVQTPEAITVTVTVPAPVAGASQTSSISLPGSVIAEETVSSAVEITPSPSPSAPGATSAENDAPAPTNPAVGAPVIGNGDKEQETDVKQPGVDVPVPSKGNNAQPPPLNTATPAICTPIIQTVTVDKAVETSTVSTSSSSTATSTSTASALPTLAQPLFRNSTKTRTRRLLA